jgi:hypothetical protein
MGFGRPSTHEATGSDLHRICLTRLCCTYRLSRPPGALFPPTPFRPCFMPVTPLGFALQRFPPPAQPVRPLGRPAPPGVVPNPPANRTAPQKRKPAKQWANPRSTAATQGAGSHLQGIEPRENPDSQPLGVTPTDGADPLLGFHLPRVFSPPATATPHCVTLLSRTFSP